MKECNHANINFIVKSLSTIKNTPMPLKSCLKAQKSTKLAINDTNFEDFEDLEDFEDFEDFGDLSKMKKAKSNKINIKNISKLRI